MDKKLVCGQAMEFGAEALRYLNGPGVYMYIRDDKALYVGSSRSLMGRAGSRKHDKRGVFIYDATSLIMFPTRTHADALKLEDQLIFELRPEHNKRGGWNQVFEQLGYATRDAASSAYKVSTRALADFDGDVNAR
jgi:hypothetical protein